MNEGDVSIIVPTYREAENLPVLVPRITDALKAGGGHGEIIVVDDDSPDDTGRVCEELADGHSLRLIVRKNERGLSSAVIEGMKQARGGILVVMDADLSHPPEKIPDLVRAIRSGEADFAIGSRYVEGGGTDGEWGGFRRMNSRVAGFLARPLTPARDPMSGFFALHADRFRSAENLNPIGYKIGLELVVKCGCEKIVEIPIFFADRTRGESKLSFREQLNYLRHLRRLYEFKLGTAAEPLQFVMVGATGMAVDLALFSLLIRVLPTGAGRAIAILVAMTWNFFLNRRVTFSRRRKRPILHQYIFFCLSCAIGAIVSWSLFAGLHATFDFFMEWPLFAAVIGIVAGTASNFLLSKHVVFR